MTNNATRLYLLLFFCCATFAAHAQVAFNTTGTAPDTTAMLDISSTSKGLLIPRLTTAQRMAITNPANGLMVFDTDRKSIAVYSTGSGWAALAADVPGRVQVSDQYPDPLYPASDYDYLGTGAHTGYKKNFGLLPGYWTSKTGISGQVVNLSANNKKFCYKGSVSNTILGIGTESQIDSFIVVYNLTTDSVYKETAGYIARYGQFTATIDTANARIFIYGGIPRIETMVVPPFSALYNPQSKGYIYYYNSGIKTPIDSASSPVGYRRDGHTAVWAASVNKLLVWGGTITSYNGSSQSIAPTTFQGYNPSTNTWSALAPCPLSPRGNHLAVYDGNDRMLVWGGDNYPTNYYDGAVYTISTNTWTMMSATNAPTSKMTSATWSGTELLLSNVNTSTNPNNYGYLAYRYDPAANSWTKTADIPALDGYSSRVYANHLWTGTDMLQLAQLIGINDRYILWRYNVAGNSWTPLAANGITGRIGIQAGATTIFNAETYGSVFQRYHSTGTSPSYGEVSAAWHYYKKR